MSTFKVGDKVIIYRGEENENNGVVEKVYDVPFVTVVTEYKNRYYVPLEKVEADEFVVFNETRSLGQNQYASRYIDGRHDYPNLGIGLRFFGDVSDYHFVKVHKDDLEEFHKRVKHYQILSREGRRDEADAYVVSLG
jgi:hypothetical protein